MQTDTKSENKMLKRIIIVLAIAVVIAGGLLAFKTFAPTGDTDAKDAGIELAGGAVEGATMTDSVAI